MYQAHRKGSMEVNFSLLIVVFVVILGIGWVGSQMKILAIWTLFCDPGE